MNMPNLLRSDLSGRSCGECSACCTALAIHELKKPPHKACPNCSSGTRCDIYPDRPDSCRAFRCQWLDGHSNEDERPDKSGLVRAFFLQRSGLHMTMSEFRPGALMDPAVRAETCELLEGDVIVTHMPFGKTWETYVPESRLENLWVFFSERRRVTDHTPANEYFAESAQAVPAT